MAYIGRDTDKISNVEVLDNITFDGSSSYTLQKNSVNFTPSSANTLLVSIDGVVQAGNFTVSGSTIDFGTAVAGTSTCDFILHYGVGLITTPADNTVSLAKLTATGTKDATTFLRGDNTFAGAGITMADQWRLTANITGTNGFITANLERIDTSGQGTLGTGMTESSGVFSFPSTGIYLVTLTAKTNADGEDNITMQIEATTNNSTYTPVAETTNGFNNALGNLHCSSLIDVTDTSNVKIKFDVSSLNVSSYIDGDTSLNKTFFTFIRLGDT
jgi:hypothetical protein